YEHDSSDAAGTVAGQISDHLARAHRMADQADLVKIELIDHGGKIRGQRVVVVSAAGLAGASVTAPIVSDAANAPVGQVSRLIVPGVGVQAPGREKYNRSAVAPVLIEQVRAITGHDERGPGGLRSRSFLRSGTGG